MMYSEFRQKFKQKTANRLYSGGKKNMLNRLLTILVALGFILQADADNHENGGSTIMTKEEVESTLGRG